MSGWHAHDKPGMQRRYLYDHGRQPEGGGSAGYIGGVRAVAFNSGILEVARVWDFSIILITIYIYTYMQYYYLCKLFTEYIVATNTCILAYI